MATATAAGKPPAGMDAPRFVYGPRALAALMPAVTRPAFRRRSPAAAQLIADWAAIMGPAIAELAAPRRFAAGTLTIACPGPVALELQHLADQLIGRINGHLGRTLVTRLRFVQEPPPPAPPPPRPPPRQAILAAGRAVAGLPPGPLRDALESLGRAVLTDRPSTSPIQPD